MNFTHVSFNRSGPAHNVEWVWNHYHKTLKENDLDMNTS